MPYLANIGQLGPQLMVRPPTSSDLNLIERLRSSIKPYLVQKKQAKKFERGTLACHSSVVLNFQALKGALRLQENSNIGKEASKISESNLFTTAS